MAGVKAVHSRVSYADLERWPEDGRRYELYDGEVYVVPSPLLLHQIVAARLYLVLSDYVKTHGGIVVFAPLDIVLTEYDVVQPDLLLFTAKRKHLLNAVQVTRVAPDLAIEILSPSTAPNDRGRKKRLLAKHGVREYWLVDPKAPSIETYRLTKGQLSLAHTATGDQAVRSTLLKKLSLRPSDLVADLP
jgi:Uma2 family endonuclease